MAILAFSVLLPANAVPGVGIYDASSPCRWFPPLEHLPGATRNDERIFTYLAGDGRSAPDLQ